MEISVIPIISNGKLLSILKIIKGNYTQYLGQTFSKAYEAGGGWGNPPPILAEMVVIREFPLRLSGNL